MCPCPCGCGAASQEQCWVYSDWDIECEFCKAKSYDGVCPECAKAIKEFENEISNGGQPRIQE